MVNHSVIINYNSRSSSKIVNKSVKSQKDNIVVQSKLDQQQQPQQHIIQYHKSIRPDLDIDVYRSPLLTTDEEKPLFECPYYDLVYTWVNGSDPDFIESISKYRDKVGAGLYRDVKGLQYSLRSSHLPVFNSVSIESNFFNLPDKVADCFIYFNDDIFIANELYPDDFIDDEKGLALHYSNWTVPLPPSRQNHTWHRSIEHSNDLLNRIWGNATRHYPHHGASFFNKKLLKLIYQTFKEEFNVVVPRKFRHPQMVSIPFLYYHFASRFFRTFTPSYKLNYYAQLENSVANMSYVYNHIYKTEPKTVCLNDGLGNNPKPEVLQQLEDFFNHLYPDYWLVHIRERHKNSKKQEDAASPKDFTKHTKIKEMKPLRRSRSYRQMKYTYTLVLVSVYVGIKVNSDLFSTGEWSYNYLFKGKTLSKSSYIPTDT
ncbi:putative glycophosphotransferase [Heterostelium album PN500]|uniref:Putative glycophosphotransferase n=1 Tax=Heterostelium pallidum (strain ATCC 26659 / Pp 5 / PN500) TaxID=670386 RepID=D3BJ78_HETP5|nr:putative glycophosphotransferase [Heterostelium album PN500]EFA77958.1 putative glycophosphotransferase [Heterostelium album PN500]|eukprot:XP_020430086.1 putative glycophosphotransferase [Heterostelium album PN500]